MWGKGEKDQEEKRRKYVSERKGRAKEKELALETTCPTARTAANELRLVPKRHEGTRIVKGGRGGRAQGQPRQERDVKGSKGGNKG